ncbi:MAG: NTP transferase domain-containing protein, partial [Eggerthellaceae bacterium]|nr:NTP transferase domain-containing protein [Eggerthellaceae bacterium]
MKALIPAAGMGTRFLPATIAVPKEMLPIVNKPVIQYIVEEGCGSGADEVIIINSHDKPAIEAHFSQHDALAQTLESKGKHDLAASVQEVEALPVTFAY